jgi:spermidine/putrescine-binding protein
VPSAKKESSNKWWLSIAASVIIVIGVAGFIYSENTITDEEQKALAALKESKEVMLLLSTNLQKGASQLQLVGTFSKAKNKFLK